VLALAAQATAAELGDKKAAIAAHEAVIQRFPDFAPSWRRLLFLYAQDPLQNARAIEAGAKAREAFPADRQVAKYQGIALFRSNNLTRASTLLQESLRSAPSDGETLFYLGQIQLRQNQPLKAKELLTEALAKGLAPELAQQARAALAKNP
jgi:predicted Zn-dependent protease